MYIYVNLHMNGTVNVYVEEHRATRPFTACFAHGNVLCSEFQRFGVPAMTRSKNVRAMRAVFKPDEEQEWNYIS